MLSFLLENWMLILVAVISGGMLLWPSLRGGVPGAGVSTGDAVRLINRDKGVLVDVCEPQEYAVGHAGGARNIPLGQLADSKALPANKALPVLVICASGARSARAAAMLRKAGYANAVSVAGGTRAWREAQLPIERDERAEAGARVDKVARGDKGDKGDKAGRREKDGKGDKAGRGDRDDAAADAPAPDGADQPAKSSAA